MEGGMRRENIKEDMGVWKGWGLVYGKYAGIRFRRGKGWSWKRNKWETWLRHKGKEWG